MKIILLMMALLLFCGCGSAAAKNSSSVAESPSSAVESVLPQQSSSSIAESAAEATQPPCLICEEDGSLQPATDKFSEETNSRKERYYSNAPAKENWLGAYKSFYNLKADSMQMLLKSAAADSNSEKAMTGLSLRSDMGIDFVYPIYTMFYANIDAVANDPQDVKAVLQDFMAGALVNYKQDNSFAGEITFRAEQLTTEGFESNLHSSIDFTPFDTGDYFSRTSLTITEGLEAQLIDFGFSPENIYAFALRFLGGEYGICFYDGEKAAFYNQNIEHGNSLSNKLYSFEELRNALCEIYDVCSVEEIDLNFSSAVTEPGIPGEVLPPDGINDGKVEVNPPTAKPVIYLYPEKETEVSVKLGYPKEHFTYTYPAYKDGWQVTAYPDGRLVNSDGSEHYYLFWEGDKAVDWDFSEGFCVKGSEVEKFLLDKLKEMGLSPREYNDFITYWAPEMSQNDYNLVTFSTEQYEALAPLEITPAPDSIFRVHMVYKAVESSVEILPQQLGHFERKGFSVLEWGGSRE